MSQWQEEKARAAVQSMFRVRAAESAPDEHGIKSVWHQGAKGADLLSYVDAKGLVNEQALSILDDHLLWKSSVGLRSGVVGGGSTATAGKASEAITFDRALSPERVKRMSRALATYSGDDRYILHIRSVVTLAANGMASAESDAQVTNVVTAEKVAAVRDERRTRSSSAPLVLAAVIGAAAVGAVLYWFVG